MLDIFYNGEAREVEDGSTVAELLQSTGVNAKFCAVELNEAILPRASFEAQKLHPGDKIEVVTFVGGG